MMKLFNYSDSKEFTLPERIYADNLENSLLKWIALINDPGTKRQYNEELKALMNQSKTPSFRKLMGSDNTFYLVFTSGRTIYVNQEEILPDFIADLEYSTTENGGRKGYALSGYRAHLKFFFSQSMTSGEQVFVDRDRVYPGAKVRAQVRILDHFTFRHALSDKMTFEFCEGSKAIGVGKIIEVTNEELKKPPATNV